MALPISFGDVVAAVKLLKAFGSSIKSTGGASEDYQRTVKQLEARLAVLQTVTQDDKITGPPERVNAILGQAQAAELEIKRLLYSSLPYESHLRAGAAKKGLAKAWKQVRWGMGEGERVGRELKQADSEMLTQQMLFDLNMSATLATLKLNSEQTMELALTQDQGSTMMHALLKDVNGKVDAIEGLLASGMHQQSAATQRRDAEALRVEQREEKSIAQVTASTKTLQNTLASIIAMFSSHHEQQMLRLENIDQKLLPPALNTTGLDDDSIAMVCSGARQLITGLSQILVALARVLLEVFGQLIHSVVRSSAYLHLAHAIPVTISFNTSDNMQLVDVLGRTHHLPFQHFRNWSKLQGMLEVRFRDCAGSDKVTAGQFRILKAKKEDAVLDESNWSESIEPRMQLLMSVEIVKLHRRVQQGSCLRQTCLGILRTTKTGGLHCSACGLRCYEDIARRPPKKVVPAYGPQDFRAEVERTRKFLRTLEKQSKHPSCPRERSNMSAPARISDTMIRRELHQCAEESRLRAARRENEGWVVQNQVVADLRKSIAEMKKREEKEACEREARDLRVFLRIHIRPSVYEASNETGSDDVVSNVTYRPPLKETPRKHVRRRTLADMVMEETTAWRTTCLSNAISEGADVDAIDPLFGTALQASASIGCIVTSSFLLEHGADPLRESPAHRSAIHAAAMNDRGDVLGLLLKSCHKALYSGQSEDIEKMLLFRDTCDAALRAATLRGCNAAVLALLNFTDRVHVGTAIWSENNLTMKIIMGEALRLGEVTVDNCVRMLKKGSADMDDLPAENHERLAPYRKMDLRL